MRPLLMAVFAGIAVTALAIGGGAYWLVRSGRLPIQGAASAKQASVAPVATHVVTLDPLVVNLADADGSAYLRVTMALRVEDTAEGKISNSSGDKAGGVDASGAVVQARDTALMVLGQQTSAALLEAGGKEVLKEELKVAFAKDNPALKVADIYFTDFLVQR